MCLIPNKPFSLQALSLTSRDIVFGRVSLVHTYCYILFIYFVYFIYYLSITLLTYLFISMCFICFIFVFYLFVYGRLLSNSDYVASNEMIIGEW
jgi:hypothetical protein